MKKRKAAAKQLANKMANWDEWMEKADDVIACTIALKAADDAAIRDVLGNSLLASFKEMIQSVRTIIHLLH